MTETTFQSRVKPWLDQCFGAEIAIDKVERNHRFLEEALELVQSCGCTASEAHQLVDYVYGRPAGEPHQEAGGVMNTLAALCLAQGFSMHDAGEVELARVWTKVEAIRAKQAAKPKHGLLPGPSEPADRATRISVVKGDPGYCEAPFVWRTRIFLDGAEVKGVVTADEVAGTIRRIATDAQGRFRFDEVNGEAVYEDLTGTVRIEIPPNAGPSAT